MSRWTSIIPCVLHHSSMTMMDLDMALSHCKIFLFKAASSVSFEDVCFNSSPWSLEPSVPQILHTLSWKPCINFSQAISDFGQRSVLLKLPLPSFTLCGIANPSPERNFSNFLRKRSSKESGSSPPFSGEAFSWLYLLFEFIGSKTHDYSSFGMSSWRCGSNLHSD